MWLMEPKEPKPGMTRERGRRLKRGVTESPVPGLPGSKGEKPAPNGGNPTKPPKNVPPVRLRLARPWCRRPLPKNGSSLNGSGPAAPERARSVSDGPPRGAAGPNHDGRVRLTEEVRERVAAAEEFPEDVVRVAECELVVEVVPVVEVAPWNPKRDGGKREQSDTEDSQTLRTVRHRGQSDPEDSQTLRTVRHRGQSDTEDSQTQRTVRHRGQSDTEDSQTLRTVRHRGQSDTEDSQTQRTVRHRGQSDTEDSQTLRTVRP
ncbi:hypothetical protein EYF80_047182 [Liparis tanakae]|uniref:Uncharacterized protein n=1 Tax=Liparis tanakae TaxID=230148 RepID=A0A4Z2FN06_9TELE|nr:hypothetical protein EYF80_047182 [Liparis tanakae]